MWHTTRVIKKRERTVRRASAREADKLFDARTKLAALEPGGSPTRPFAVGSASQIEGRAEQIECLRCGAPSKIAEHRAVHHPDAGSVRELDLRCPRCGERRTVWFRVVSPLQ